MIRLKYKHHLITGSDDILKLEKELNFKLDHKYSMELIFDCIMDDCIWLNENYQFCDFELNEDMVRDAELKIDEALRFAHE